MPLPKLESNKFTTQIPSTKEEIEFRPFLVKEEKILMIAQESEDEKQIMSAMKDIVSACTFGKVDADNCTMYDIEYLFLQLRMKSIGETTTLNLKCEECGEFTEVEIDLNDVKVVWPKKEVSNTIALTDDIGITLKPITLKSATKVTGTSEEIFNQALIQSIESIYDADSVYSAADTSEKEILEFIDSMSHSQLEEIQSYLNNQPIVKHTVKFKCKHDGHVNKIELKGIQSFF